MVLHSDNIKEFCKQKVSNKYLCNNVIQETNKKSLRQLVSNIFKILYV